MKYFIPFQVVLLLLVGLVSSPAEAAVAQITAVPTGWRLENYVGGAVTLWLTPSSCANGQIVLPSSATTEEKNRFFALVMAAKTSGRPMFVYYDDATTGCQIISFGTDS